MAILLNIHQIKNKNIAPITTNDIDKHASIAQWDIADFVAFIL